MDLATILASRGGGEHPGSRVCAAACLDLAKGRRWAPSPSVTQRRGQRHHGPTRGTHPPDLLLLQCPGSHHRPGHLPCDHECPVVRGAHRGGGPWQGLLQVLQDRLPQDRRPGVQLPAHRPALPHQPEPAARRGQEPGEVPAALPVPASHGLPAVPAHPAGLLHRAARLPQVLLAAPGGPLEGPPDDPAAAGLLPEHPDPLQLLYGSAHLSQLQVHEPHELLPEPGGLGPQPVHQDDDHLLRRLHRRLGPEGLHAQVRVEMLQTPEVRELGRGEGRPQDAPEGGPADLRGSPVSAFQVS
ncbi:lysosomal-associated transmembrane protein 5 isoform X1 [Marmota monax]|uniref:lysosomal-associated transmembrane protein 5 isoform X1 n=1 Tax=Marmota monax TaxID=9995 RepID=UPI001EAFB5ED|nr:lysosomal-associated transmembrane protein 5 isoform X1 [Marmota monax]